MSALDQTWRQLLQLLSFALFGVGALLLGGVVFPLLWLWPAPAVKKTGWIQKIIHYSFRLFLWFIESFGGMEFHFKEAHRLRESGGGLIIANHPTLLDVVVLISRLPQADCIVKKALWDNVFLRLMVTWAGYMPNDEGPLVAQEAMDRVRRGRKVIIFPEGTRSLPDGMRPFSKGFAHIAVRSSCLFWPVVMTCEPSALTKGLSVFHVPSQRARLNAAVGEPLNPKDYFDAADSPAIAVRKVTEAAQQYFEERVH